MQEDPEKRGLMRRRVLKDEKIIINPPSGTLDVKIRDLSENGAKLEVLATTPLPEKFDFIIVANATVTHAEVMWRNLWHRCRECAERQPLSQAKRGDPLVTVLAKSFIPQISPSKHPGAAAAPGRLQLQLLPTRSTHLELMGCRSDQHFN